MSMNREKKIHNCAEGWICEKHPQEPWPHFIGYDDNIGTVREECAGPGMPCDYPSCELSMSIIT